MKILKVKVNGICGIAQDFEINFLATQRSTDTNKNMVYPISNNINVNNIIAITGINASGKTTTLKILSIAIDILKGYPINQTLHKNILYRGTKITYEIVFTHNDYIFKLETVISDTSNDIEKKYSITEEMLYRKKILKGLNKNNIFQFSKNPITDRSNFVIPNDVSIAFSVVDASSALHVIDAIPTNDIKIVPPIPFFKKMPEHVKAITEFLDPSIEYFHTEDAGDTTIFKLKYKNSKEYVFYDEEDFYTYLSSGTNRGLFLFGAAMSILYYGGYFIVDELENCLNKQIVISLIDLFMDKAINKHGACLVFSTHYPEILDSIERNDSIYITENKEYIGIKNLSSKLKRSDLKKSEIYMSGTLFDTAPSYENFKNLRNILKTGTGNID